MTDDPTADFWDLAQEYLSRDAVEKGRLMSFDCLRVDGEFFATCEHRSGDLIVKVHRDRVSELVSDGVGEPFAPAGRVFREWVRVPTRDDDRWRSLMDEALEFNRHGHGADS